MNRLRLLQIVLRSCSCAMVLLGLIDASIAQVPLSPGLAVQAADPNPFELSDLPLPIEGPVPVIAAPPPAGASAVYSGQLDQLIRRLESLEETNKLLNLRIQQLEGTPRTPRETADPVFNGAQSVAESSVSSETDGRTSRDAYDSKPPKRLAKVTFADGLEFASDDEQFRLTFHNLTQVDYRAFPADQHGYLQDQFFIPRERWYFTGQATRSVEFYTSINRGYGSLDVLDAFITLNPVAVFTHKETNTNRTPHGAQGMDGRVAPDNGRGTDNRIRIRVGRMKTPYLYEYYSIAEGDLVAPERSLYATNLAGNRKEGIMVVGELFRERLGYAAGVFNSARHSFGETGSSGKDLYFYLNSRPFLNHEQITPLSYLNIGGSFNFGHDQNNPQPNIFTTASDQSGQSSNGVVQSLSPTFLAFNSNVTELGLREQWAANVDYFHESLTLLAEYGGGFQNYSTDGHTSVAVPMDGYMFQAAYFLTGEKMTRRVNVVRPLHPFGYDENGHFGCGAFEVHARYSKIRIGSQVFSAGLADSQLWANRAEAVDVGINWYWNYYTKIMLDWQHATYNQPVTTGNPGHFVRGNDLYWLRFQLFF